MKTQLFSSMLDLEKSLIWPIGLKNGKDGTAEDFHLTSIVRNFKADFFARREDVKYSWKLPKCKLFWESKAFDSVEFIA